MSSETLERRFAAVGARVKVAEGPWRGEPRIDVRADAERPPETRGGAGSIPAGHTSAP
jgi:hypothetical protein